ncbi:MAG TPA: hypothetical protein VF597_00625 [Candidatus Saccharimonadales bacterium]|jgi:hypothetical protein
MTTINLEVHTLAGDIMILMVPRIKPDASFIINNVSRDLVSQFLMLNRYGVKDAPRPIIASDRIPRRTPLCAFGKRRQKDKFGEPLRYFSASDFAMGLPPYPKRSGPDLQLLEHFESMSRSNGQAVFIIAPC